MERHEVCVLLDKLTLEMLRLMEDRVKSQVNIENASNNGSIHLAKSRYIMGQNSVSIVQLPTENTPDFSALSTVDSDVRDDVLSNEVRLSTRSSEPNTEYVNPLRWFGVLVTSNLHEAQNVFKRTVSYIVESVNIQKQLTATCDAILKLKQLKLKLQPEE